MMIRAAVTFAVVVLTGLVFFALFFAPLPTENRDTVFMMAGGVMAAFGLAIGYWLGSSQSSAGKDHTIQALTKEGE